MTTGRASEPAGAPTSDLDVATVAYARRFERLFAYVDEHLEGDLSIDVLSKVAGVSRFHLQRQFSRLFQLSLHQYVQFVRFRRATFQLAFRPNRILDVALDAGYSSHEAFTRAFEKAIGQVPSEFRGAPNWDAWFRAQDRLRTIRACRPATLCADDVRVENVSGMRLAVMEHRGDPRLLPETLRRFIAWRRRDGVSPTCATYNLVYDDPDVVAARDFRFDICVAVERLSREAERVGVREKFIPPGRCAVFRHVGSEDALWRKVGDLYAAWLPASGEEAGDLPLFLRRVRFFPDVPERDAATDVFLPLREPAR
jgi:AraC family transcriptional regulator